MDPCLRFFDPEILKYAISWDMPAFLKKYTLHDSVFEEMRLSASGGIVFVVKWDLHWNQGIPSDYERLAIIFPLAYSFTWTQGGWHYSTMEGATSEVVAPSQRAAMLSEQSIDLRAFQTGEDEIQHCAFDESLTRTVFQGMNWSRITVLHNAKVLFLCFTESESFFSIPKDAVDR